MWTGVLNGQLFANVFEEADGTVLLTDYDYYNIHTLSSNTQVWTKHFITKGYFNGVATSSDGLKIFVAVPGMQDGSKSQISMSTDSGTTWADTAVSPARTCFTSIAASSSGMTVIAYGRKAQMTISTDGGASWHSPTKGPTDDSITKGQAMGAISLSGDGTRAAVTSGLDPHIEYICSTKMFWGVSGLKMFTPDLGYIHTSSDSGLTWAITTAPAAHWMSVASSSDGLKLAAVVWSGGIYISTDSGGSWTLTSATTQQWISIASSSDGSRLFAGVFDGGLYLSTNGGTLWSQLTSAPTNSWARVESSADGSELVALSTTGSQAAKGGAWISFDSGDTWTKIASEKEAV